MAIARAVQALIGEPLALPPALLARYPELEAARFRRGGLLVRIGGWCLGTRSVAGITLWRTVWLAPEAAPAPRLLLHELRHVHQFGARPLLFPLLYVWESLRRGYRANRFEVDAEAFARGRLAAVTPPDSPKPS
ncbi:MAG TPA: hypothetical protein VFS08_18965 [Gemmatimonadaceae bacterium]|nr:hypothetical protein [Gemmatimonadaceae bacterium]